MNSNNFTTLNIELLDKHAAMINDTSRNNRKDVESESTPLIQNKAKATYNVQFLAFSEREDEKRSKGMDALVVLIAIFKFAFL